MNTSGSRKHLLWNTHGPISLCLLKISLTLIMQWFFSFYRVNKAGSTPCFYTYMSYAMICSHCSHILCTSVTAVCVQGLREQLSWKTVVCFLSQLASKEQPDTCALTHRKWGHRREWAGTSVISLHPMHEGMKMPVPFLSQNFWAKPAMSAFSQSEGSWSPWLSGENKIKPLISWGLRPLWVIPNIFLIFNMERD